MGRSLRAQAIGPGTRRRCRRALVGLGDSDASKLFGPASGEHRPPCIRSGFIIHALRCGVCSSIQRSAARPSGTDLQIGAWRGRLQPAPPPPQLVSPAWGTPMPKNAGLRLDLVARTPSPPPPRLHSGPSSPLMNVAFRPLRKAMHHHLNTGTTSCKSPNWLWAQDRQVSHRPRALNRPLSGSAELRIISFPL